MVLKHIHIVLFALVVGLWCAGPAHATPLLTPPGLNPGDQFRLAFVSSTTRDALSPSIADYDLFITNLAVAVGIDTYFGSSVAWEALGSTATVNARDRLTGTSTSPLYRIDGAMVSFPGLDLWTGPGIVNPINVTESGDVVATLSPVWTGTNGGTGNLFPLGPSFPYLTQYGLTGLLPLVGSEWVSYDVLANIGPIESPLVTRFRYYGYSSVLTVPAVGGSPVPEPASLPLVLVGLAALAGGALRRRLLHPENAQYLGHHWRRLPTLNQAHGLRL